MEAAERLAIRPDGFWATDEKNADAPHPIDCWPVAAAPPTSRGRASCSPCRSAANSKIPQRLQRPTNPACCHDRAPAAADACSSSRPSRAAASQSTDPRPRRPRSGSTPHDAVIADPAPHRSAPFWPALAWQHTSLRRSARLARDRTANPVEQRAIRSFAPARTLKIPAKAIRSPASAQLPQHTRRRQIPIAPAALSVPHTPRFRALALFGRRLSERGDGLGMPASENLHKKRRLPECHFTFSMSGILQLLSKTAFSGP
jgi:hypothetical protein